MPDTSQACLEHNNSQQALVYKTLAHPPVYGKTGEGYYHATTL